jgi:ribokinase
MENMRESAKLDVLCAADLCVDLIVSGNVRPEFGQVEKLIGGYELEVGGSACIFASQFAKLGGRAGLIGSLGMDTLGTFLHDKLKRLGVDLSRVNTKRDVKTGLGITLSEPHDRAILTYSGSIDATTAASMQLEFLSATRHWHIASYFLLTRLREFWPQWLKRARSAGVTTSLDTNWDPLNHWDGVRELLPLVDIFLPNENEALAITRATDVLHAGRELARDGNLIVIKCGERGAIAFLRDQVIESNPTLGDVCVIDSIGAGDCFDAGFLRAWQLQRSIEECLEWGARCGRASLAAAGGIAAQANLEMMERVSA